MLDPGFTFDMSATDYHADPCPSPSLSQSIAKVLINRSPAHAWTAHPRLNQAYEATDPKKYDVGNIAHALLLGRGKSLQVIDGDDWVADRKAKSEARAAATAEGKLAVLSRDYEVGKVMAEFALAQLDERGFGPDWSLAEGSGEVVIAWQEGPLWFRAMIDWLAKDRRRIWDYKTTAVSAAPHTLDRKAIDDGWEVQAAMHARGLDVLDPDNAGRREHLFVCQENEPPYALTVVKLGKPHLAMGAKKLAYAVSAWARAVESGQWPAYPTDTLIPHYPEYLEQRWLDREITAADATERRGGMVSSLMGG